MSTQKRTAQVSKPNIGAARSFASLNQENAKTPQTSASEKVGSGLVPAGDVRLTANIREDLHLKLKIAAATGRTTIGEIIEGLVEKHL